MNLDQLTKQDREAKRKAWDQLPKCPTCNGKPHIAYEPGCVFTKCLAMHQNCPCIAAAPDFELDLLVERVRGKVNSGLITK